MSVYVAPTHTISGLVLENGLNLGHKQVVVNESKGYSVELYKMRSTYFVKFHAKDRLVCREFTTRKDARFAFGQYVNFIQA